MTEKYLSKRGRCCTSGCRNCPYGFTENKKIDPSIPQEFQDNWSQEDGPIQHGFRVSRLISNLFSFLVNFLIRASSF